MSTTDLAACAEIHRNRSIASTIHEIRIGRLPVSGDSKLLFEIYNLSGERSRKRLKKNDVVIK